MSVVFNIFLALGVRKAFLRRFFLVFFVGLLKQMLRYFVGGRAKSTLTASARSFYQTDFFIFLGARYF